MEETGRPWWAAANAYIETATLLDDETDCPACGKPTGAGGIKVVFPQREQSGLIQMLGYVFPCGHWLESQKLVFLPHWQDAGPEFMDGTPYPVRIRNDKTGAIDIIPVPIDEGLS